MLVLQQVVQDVDGRLAGEEHLDDEVRGAAIDGDERARRVRTVDKRHQHLQPHMHHIQRRPTGQGSRQLLPLLARHSKYQCIT